MLTTCTENEYKVKLTKKYMKIERGKRNKRKQINTDKRKNPYIYISDNGRYENVNANLGTVRKNWKCGDDGTHIYQC